LVKQADTGEVVDIKIYNGDLDKIDELLGAVPVLSTARPNVPFQGMIIYETDTKCAFMWDGTTWMFLGGRALGPGGGTYHSVTEVNGAWTANIRRQRVNDSALLLSGFFYAPSSTAPFNANAAFNNVVNGWTPHPNDFPEWCKTTAGQSTQSATIVPGVISGSGQNAGFHAAVSPDGAVAARVQTTIAALTSSMLFSFGPVLLFRTA
jgi:hypothetical protein